MREGILVMLCCLLVLVLSFLSTNHWLLFPYFIRNHPQQTNLTSSYSTHAKNFIHYQSFSYIVQHYVNICSKFKPKLHISKGNNEMMINEDAIYTELLNQIDQIINLQMASIHELHMPNMLQSLSVFSCRGESNFSNEGQVSPKYQFFSLA